MSVRLLKNFRKTRPGKGKILLLPFILFAYANASAQTFTPITDAGNPLVTDEGGLACAWGDYDNDGLQDAFITPNFLYHNEDNGNFARILSSPIASASGNAAGASWSDYDNDGLVDLFVVFSDTQSNALYRNLGNGNFVQLTHLAITQDGGSSNCASWADYDRDGWLDLFVARGGGAVNLLYHNDGNGGFTKITTSVVATEGGAAISSNWVDYDNDGDLDLFVANVNAPNFFYRNEGGGNFTKIDNLAITSESLEAAGSSWADYDNDGDWDLILATGGSQNDALYRNDGNGSFTKMTSSPIASDALSSTSANWGDFDNDGDEDLFVANLFGAGGDRLYQNDGNGGFARLVGHVIENKPFVNSHGSSWEDYDNDGDMDLFVTTQTTGQGRLLYRNEGTSNNWIKLACEGLVSNAAAIGAVVKVKATINGNSFWQMRQLTAQTGLRSQSSLLAEFGLGNATLVDSIRVLWPSGQISALANQAVNRTLILADQASEILIRPLPDTTTTIDGPILSLLLNDYFDNASGSLSYNVGTSDSSKLFVQILFPDNVLKITPLAVGSAEVIVEAFDFISESFASDTFRVTVANATQPPALVKVYWTEIFSSSIQRANSDGTQHEALMDSLPNNPLDLAIDFSRGKMYWCENFAATAPKIQRANLDGSGQETIIDFSGLLLVPSLALDVPNQKIYWAANPTFTGANNAARRTPGSISRANLDGSNIETINTTVEFPVGLAVGGGKVYWYDDATGLIERANVNGDSVESIIEQPSQENAPLAVDVVEGKIYWIADNYLRRANLDGSGYEDLLVGTGKAFDLTLDAANRKVYWFSGAGESGEGVIRRANFEGSHIETLPFLNLAAVYGLGADGSNHAPEQFAFPFPPLSFRRNDPPRGIELKSYFRDPDGDSLLFVAVSSDTNVASVRVSNDLLIITPHDGGSAELRLLVKDLRGGSFAFSDTITVALNQPPIVRNFVPDTTLVLMQPATNWVIELRKVFFDLEGDTLLYRATIFDPRIVSGRFTDSTFIVTPQDTGKTFIALAADDGYGGAVADSFFVTVIGVQQNRPPVLVNEIPDVTLVAANPGFKVVLDLRNVFSDPDEDVLSYRAASSNAGVALATITGSILTVAPADSGTTLITVSADDGKGGTTSATFTARTVTSNVAPRVVAGIADQFLTKGTPLFRRALRSHFVDDDGDLLAFGATSSHPQSATANITLNSDTLEVAPIDTGSAIITVFASDGKGGQATATFNVVVYLSPPPVITHTSVAQQNFNQAITLAAKITDNENAVRSATLFYREAGESNFVSIKMDTTRAAVDSLRATAVIPSNVVGVSGVEYYLEAKDKHGVPGRAPQFGVFSVRVQIGGEGIDRGAPQTAGTSQTGYRLFSIPLELDNKNAEAVLRDDLGAYDDRQWRFYEWRNEANGDLTKVESPATSAITPGKAFWLIVRNSDRRIDSGTGVTVSTAGKFAINLNKGWNLIANPFNFAASAAPLLSNGDSLYFYAYENGWSAPRRPSARNRFEPFEGYAVFSDTAATMFVLPNEFAAQNVALPKQESHEMLWSIRIMAQCQEARDENNLLAVVSSASREWDTQDHPEPPALGEYVSVYFPHEEWKRLSKNYCTDVRPEPNESEEWDFAIETNIRDEVRLTFEGIASVPREYEVWLIDKALQIAHDLRRNSCYSVTGRGPENPKRLTLLVNRAGRMKEEYEALQAAPTTFELSQNFPNPFNPATTMRYSLPKPERVTLQVFNLLGGLIATLVDDEQKEAGYHVAIWNGRSTAGQAVGNGVYFVRMQAGEFVQARKVVLVE